jgi:hypothetical protein
MIQPAKRTPPSGGTGLAPMTLQKHVMAGVRVCDIAEQQIALYELNEIETRSVENVMGRVVQRCENVKRNV